jgi:hypothetical protein
MAAREIGTAELGQIINVRSRLSEGSGLHQPELEEDDPSERIDAAGIDHTPFRVISEAHF